MSGNPVLLSAFYRLHVHVAIGESDVSDQQVGKSVDENRDFSLRKLHLIDYFDHPDKNGTENSCCKEKYSGCLCLVLTEEGKSL